MITRHDHKAHHGSRQLAGRRGQPKGRRDRRLRIEPLEQRELLAVASSGGSDLVYTATSGEQNAVVLSPGAYFSIQDDPGVSQVGSGGCVSSAYLAALNWSVSYSMGSEWGDDPQISWSVGVGFGAPLIVSKLPDGIICPTPSGVNAAGGGVDESLREIFSDVTKGSSSVVAGAKVLQADNVYYNVSASSGFVDEYRLYQRIVDPATAIQETDPNNTFGQADAITTNTLVQGDFTAGKGDVDFYKFNVRAGDRIAVLLDNNALGDGQYANTQLALYDSTGAEVASNVSFSQANAVGAITVPFTLLPGPYYVSVADNGYGHGTHYRFVVVQTTNGANENTSKPATFDSGSLNMPLPDLTTTESILPVGVSSSFARASSMSVTLNIQHSYDSDLSAYLVSPSGVTVTLFSHVDGSDDNFTNTTFSDSASVSIGSGSAPFSGTFHPQGNLSDFANELINGDWKLRIVDDRGGDSGTLLSWSLKFNDTNNETPANADPLTLTQYAKGRVPSSSDQDYFKVTDASIDVDDLVFAYVDTTDTDGKNTDSRDSFLKVFDGDGTELLGQDDDSGPAVSTGSYDDFNKQVNDAGVDLSELSKLLGGGITVKLGDGNDSCDASKIDFNGNITINGDEGNDTIYAPGGNNVNLHGGSGNDTFVLNTTVSVGAANEAETAAGGTIDGGDGDNDVIEINEPTGNLNITVDFVSGSNLIVTVGNVVSHYRISGIEGITINGGYQLTVVDAGDGDCTVWRQNADGQSGSINVGALPQISYTGVPFVRVLPVDSTLDGYGSDKQGRVVVFPADPMEDNNSRRVATDFNILTGSHYHPTIDLAGDQDWYRYVAPQTGTFAFQLDYEPIGTLLNGNAGLPGDGNLKITVYDQNGNPIAKILGEGNDSHTIGVEAGKTYYVCVRGASSDSINVYDVNLVDVDTFGPQVTGVSITGNEGYNLFSQKQLDAGNTPTPLVWSISVSIQDAVLRRPDFLYPALSEAVGENPGHYRLVGDANGVISIASVEVVNDPVVAGNMATATIILHFASPLPDDRFTLTIGDDVTDPAGNGFDGETNTLEPRPDPIFPSGDGVAGGDFSARFTVDSRPEIGVWTAGSIYVDTNGNFQYDTTNSDASNRDYAYSLGYTSDVIFAGNFTRTPTDTADGFSKLAAYGKLGKTARWLIDVNNDGVTDIFQTDPANIVGTPVAGNFDGNAANGDEVGLFDGKAWYLDVSHDYMVRNSAADLRIANGMVGTPIVGDFDGDGHVDLATYNAGKFYFSLFDVASNSYGKPITIDVGYLNYAGARMRPVAADMDMDGITDIGLWCPDRAGTMPQKTGEWYFLVSDDLSHSSRVTGTVNRLNHSFTLLPPSKDIFARMGSEFSVPVLGNFDPPVVDGQGKTVVSTDSVTVSLTGTSRSEQFVVAPGAEAGNWVITLDGKTQIVQAASLDLSIDGGGGRDSLKLAATAADDQIECWPSSAKLVADGYTVSVRGVASISIDARGGDNSATLHGSSGIDKLTAAAKTASLSGSGYSTQVLGAGHVIVDGGSGGKDSATLNGTSGADAFFASLASASLSGSDYAIDLTGFRTVRVQAGSGGLDTATLVGSTGADSLTATARSSKLSGAGFLFETTGFDVVNVDGGGGNDTASITGGLVDGSRGSNAIGSLPDPYHTAAWLSHFTRIYQNKKLRASGAVDKLFGAFWK